ncbi:DNA starvation/stationary phase protection protein [Streptomyces sp. NPDC021562]|uniref:Dps family protein n=1 Tax=Streptomyces sp. NPDC021562 TaxID=3155121 RepID=UPI001045BB3B
MTIITSPIAEQDRDHTGAVLQRTLVDLLDLSLLAKQAHWNVYGPRFRAVHQQLDEVVTTARDYADQVAERAAALGISPDGRAGTVADSSRLPAFQAGWIADRKVVEDIVQVFSTLIGLMRTRIEEAGRSDAVTQDLLISLTAALEKQSWMFQAENRA